MPAPAAWTPASGGEWVARTAGGGAGGAATVACVRRGAAVGLLGASSGTGRPAVPAGAVVPERRHCRYIRHRRLWHTRRWGGVVNRVAGMVRVTMGGMRPPRRACNPRPIIACIS